MPDFGLYAYNARMKFVVRYWSSLLPKVSCEGDESPVWVDYSVHPASKLGLHNALLAVYDRLDILKAHGGQFGCAVFVLEEGRSEKLSQEMAQRLFAALPRGDVQWLDIKQFLLPVQPEAPSETTPPSTDPPETSPPVVPPPLFQHTHTAYDDLEPAPHRLDIDI